MIESGTNVRTTLPFILCDADGENEKRFEAGSAGVVVERLTGGGSGAALIVELAAGYQVTFEEPRGEDDAPYGFEVVP